MKNKLYRCDPDKNIKCSKRNCYRKHNDCCYKTTEKQYKMNTLKRIKEFIGGKIWKMKNLKDWKK